MGDEGDDVAPTGAASTDLGSAIEETAALTAWSLDDGEDWPARRLTSARITGMVVAGTVMVVAVATMVVWMVLRDRSEPPVAGPALGSTVQPTPPSTVAAASASTAPPTPRIQPPTQVTLPMDPYGQVHVRTVSGRTVCAMTAGDVQCNVHFTNQLGPISNGMPASGVGINSRGAFQWLYGDPGDPEYVTMAYGTVYRAMGWIITPSGQGTTFMYDATGHEGGATQSNWTARSTYSESSALFRPHGFANWHRPRCVNNARWRWTEH